MKQILFSKHWPEAFVFDDAYVLDISDDAVRISTYDHGDLLKPEITEPSIRKCPALDINAFGKHTLRELIKLVQFTSTLRSARLGIVKHNDNYSVCADGAYWRRIRSASISGALTRTELTLSVAVDAGPVECIVESQPPGPLSASDLEPFVFSYDFIVPIGSVPEMLDMNRVERKQFGNLIGSFQ